MKLDPEKWIYESVNRSGILTILQLGQQIGEQIPGLSDWAIFGGEDRTTRRSTSLMGAIFGPSYDLAEKLGTVAMGLDSPTQSTLHTARTALVPYQNHFLFARAIDALEGTIADVFNVPERRDSN
jgi:hypothetical protein